MPGEVSNHLGIVDAALISARWSFDHSECSELSEFSDFLRDFGDSLIKSFLTSSSTSQHHEQVR